MDIKIHSNSMIHSKFVQEIKFHSDFRSNTAWQDNLEICKLLLKINNTCCITL